MSLVLSLRRIRNAGVWLAVIAALLAGTLHMLRGTAAGAWLSYYVKHQPLCALESAGLRDPTRTYYSPSTGQTKGILRCAPSAPPRLAGGPLDRSLIVVSDMGGLVRRLAPDGHVVWQRRLWMPRGADVAADRLYVLDGHTLNVLDVHDGRELAQYPIAADALALRLVGDHAWIAQDGAGAGSLVEYALSTDGLHEVRRYALPLQGVRGLDVTADAIWIADTLGQRVLKVDRATGAILASAASYFPNSVDVVGDSVFVAEEHLNRVGEFSTALVRKPSRLGCSTVHGVLDVATAKRQANQPGADGESRCRRRGGAQAADLFSPNDFARSPTLEYVADTDNHRIAAFRNGEFFAEVTGFNSPVNVLLLETP